MGTPEEIYVNGIKKHYRHFFAAWPPDEALALGDVGLLDNNLFIRIKNIQAPELNISFVTREPTSRGMLDLMSDSGVSVAVKAAGESSHTLLPNVPEAEAGMSIQFTKQGAFILKAPITSVSSVEDIDLLGKNILDAYLQGRWNIRWAVVVRAVLAPKSTIIVSRSAESKLELLVKGNLSSGTIDLGNGQLSFSVRSQTGDLFQSIGATNTTPLFQLARIRKSLLGIPEIDIVTKSPSRRLLPTDLVTPANARGDSSLGFDLITDIEE
jgi:hypothetical protein